MSEDLHRVSSKWKGCKRSEGGAYIACLSKGQKWGFKYMKVATDSSSSRH
jgi:hypothetical protein